MFILLNLRFYLTLNGESSALHDQDFLNIQSLVVDYVCHILFCIQILSVSNHYKNWINLLPLSNDCLKFRNPKINFSKDLERESTCKNIYFNFINIKQNILLVYSFNFLRKSVQEITDLIIPFIETWFSLLLINLIMISTFN